MAKPILSDELWAAIEPLLPVHQPSAKGGRPRLNDRAALTGILYVLYTGIPWEYLPKEMGCGCGMTCWRRLRDWQKAGVWQRLHESVLHKLRQYDQIEWERASIDSASVPSPPWRGSHRPQSHGPGKARLQAPRHRRSTRRATGGATVSSQCP